MRAFLPDETRVTQVHLRTQRLKPAVQFYSGVLGLTLVWQDGGSAGFAARRGGPSLLVLSEPSDESPAAPASAGLYHFALRYPRRPGLAQAYRQLVRQGYPIEGASDHGVCEALYLTDPDGHGVELYADRPREAWPWRDDGIAMASRVLDVDDLLNTLKRPPRRQSNLTDVDLGHVHLRVTDLAVAEQFYGEFLGLAVTQRSCPGALFFAAGGYHHHIAVNVWPQNEGPHAKVGLISYRLDVPCAELLFCLRERAPLLGYETRLAELEQPLLQVRDPNGNWLELQSSAPAAHSQPGCRWSSGGWPKFFPQ